MIWTTSLPLHTTNILFFKMKRNVIFSSSFKDVS
jgi:hypothetical protein